MRLIIDCDPGNGISGADVDDALAIGMAVRSQEVQLEAVTVVAGNVEVDQGVRGALAVLDAASAGHVPVHRGADRPLMQDPKPWRDVLDTRRDDPAASRLWSELLPASPNRVADPTPAAQALVEEVDGSPGEITVLAIGPLTNLATAILLDPEWPRKVKQVFWMGGAFNLLTVMQELNAAYDAEATHLLLTSDTPMTVVPLDVTLQTRMRLDDVDRLEAAGTELGSYLGQTLRPWVTWLSERFGRDGCPLHDPLAMAALLDPQVIRSRALWADIELAGRLTRGRTVAWDVEDDETMHVGVHLPDQRPVHIASEVDNRRFMPLLLDLLAGPL